MKKVALPLIKNTLTERCIYQVACYCRRMSGILDTLFSPFRRNRGQSFFERDHAWFFLLFAFLLRFAVFCFILVCFGDTGFFLSPFSDGQGYVTIAQNLLPGHGFSLDTAEPYSADIKRVPLYPLFLASTFALTGGAWWLAALLQVVIGSAVVFWIYRLTLELWEKRAAFFAAVFASIQPFAIFLSTQLLAEALFSAVLFASFVFLFRALRSEKRYVFLIAGLIAGLAMLVKPAAEYVPVLMTPLIALAERGVKRLSNPVLYLLGIALIISPWIIRNDMVSGIPTISYESSVLFSLHLAGYNAYKATGAAGNEAHYRPDDTYEAVVGTPQSEYFMRVLRTFASDPIGFSKYLAITTVPFLFGDGFVTIHNALTTNSSVPAWDFSTSASMLGRTIGFGVLPPQLLVLSIVSKALWALVLLAALWGFVSLVLKGTLHLYVGIACALAITYFMLAGGPVNSARYRQPVEPLFFVLAGIGVANIWSRIERTQK